MRNARRKHQPAQRCIERCTSAENSIQAVDYGTATSNLAKYQVLSQTGISALAQANSTQQEILKLLQ